MDYVSIHARLATGDILRRNDARGVRVSIHARLATGDPKDCKRRKPSPRFNSRPSRDGRPDADVKDATNSQFQFTPVSRRATDFVEDMYLKKGFQFTPVSRRATVERLGKDCKYVMFQFTPVSRRAT